MDFSVSDTVFVHRRAVQVMRQDDGCSGFDKNYLINEVMTHSLFYGLGFHTLSSIVSPEPDVTGPHNALCGPVGFIHDQNRLM